MKRRYLEVTFRRGKPLAAYIYFPRAPGACSIRTEDVGQGLRVDFDEAGTAMGIEITAPSAVEMAELNAVLAQLGQPPMGAEEWAPARAA